MAAIIDQLHNKYGKLVASLMQENSELQAAVEAQGAELDEYRSRALAQASQPVQGLFKQEGQPDQPVVLTDITDALTGQQPGPLG
jgi:hypothetical protein